jgi:hypothetical protein
MSANVNEVTVVVLAVKVALVAPAGTVTLAGTVTRAVLLLDSDTTAPPAGAGAPRITLPVDGVPPTTVLGLNSTLWSMGNNRRKSLKLSPAKVVEIVTVVVLVTALVVIGNVALICPAGTVTLAGMLAELESSESWITTPPLGAGALKVAVPVAGWPPITVSGLWERLQRRGGPPGVISRSALCPGLPARFASTFRLNWNVTGEVAMLKLALVAPAGTVTL